MKRKIIAALIIGVAVMSMCSSVFAIDYDGPIKPGSAQKSQMGFIHIVEVK